MLLAVLTGGGVQPARAQLPESPAPGERSSHVHVGHVASRYFDTPSGLGLLPTAAAEAEIAIQHAELAVQDSLYLEGMRRHAGHVLHALDPSLVPEGPGLGYGVRRATEGILDHVRLAGAAEDASDNVRTHAEYMAGAARSALDRLERAVALATRLRSATSAAAAAATARELAAVTRALWLGQDTDRDRLVVWMPPEGGLRQVQQHMTLLRRGEGLAQEGFVR